MVWMMSLVGLVILLLSGDLLVRGAVNLSLRLGVPALIVSLTIVAFGTSAPELLIAISAVDDGASGIAIGNVIGSNIANVLLVLGMPALLSTLDFSQCDTRRDFYIMLGATVVAGRLDTHGASRRKRASFLMSCYLGQGLVQIFLKRIDNRFVHFCYIYDYHIRQC